MCESCEADAVYCSKQLFDTFYVIRARKDGDEMKKDEWGLAIINGPFCIFSITPYPDPFGKVPDEYINNCSEKEWDSFIKWREDWRTFDTQLMETIDSNSFAKLVVAAIGAGFSFEKDGQITMWIFDKLGELISTSVLEEDKDPEDPHS